MAKNSYFTVAKFFTGIPYLNGLSRRIYFWHLFLLGSCFRLGKELKKNTSQNFGHLKKKKNIGVIPHTHEVLFQFEYL